MIKDTFFSGSRFTNLCRKQMVESWRANVLRLAMIYGVMAIAFIWNGYFEYERPASMGNYGLPGVDPCLPFILNGFLFFFAVFGLIAASFSFERMKTKTGRLNVLMTPATPFEKFFSNWIVSTVVYIIVFLIAFKLADYTRVLVYMLSYPELDVIAAADLSMLTGTYGQFSVFQTVNNFLYAGAGYFFFQSCFVLGSAIWPKNSFVKTFAAGMIVFVVYVLVGVGFSKMLFPDHLSYNPDVSQTAALCVLSTIALFFALLNWTLAYFRFKESEIINRM